MHLIEIPKSEKKLAGREIRGGDGDYSTEDYEAELLIRFGNNADDKNFIKHFSTSLRINSEKCYRRGFQQGIGSIYYIMDEKGYNNIAKERIEHLVNEAGEMRHSNNPYPNFMHNFIEKMKRLFK